MCKSGDVERGFRRLRARRREIPFPARRGLSVWGYVRAEEEGERTL